MPSKQQIDDLLKAISAAYSAYGWIPDKDFVSLLDEVARLAGIIEEGCDASFNPEDIKAKARAVLARYGNQPPQPIPLAERMPGPTDCDARGRCWWGIPGSFGTVDPSWQLRSDSYTDDHWLPYNAFPLPPTNYPHD